VKPQSAAFLEKSREFLAKAQDLLDAHHWPDEAGRAAYLAGLHAAQALIFESTGKVIKRHKGVQREFGRLAKDDPRLDMDLRRFLGRAYNQSYRRLRNQPWRASIRRTRPRGDPDGMPVCGVRGWPPSCEWPIALDWFVIGSP
jgi:uncharacterized protein (UPF0332 family)